VPTDAGVFEAFYAGPIQHPWLLWVAAGAALAFCATRASLSVSTRRYCSALGLLSMLDAWLTSNHVYGVGALPSWAASAVPLFFVLAGDFRYLLLLHSAREGGGLAPTPRGCLAAAGLTLFVPVFSQLVVSVLPESMSGARTLFLVYELAFATLALSLLTWHPRVRSVSWLRSVTRFVLLYYALWASADAIILFAGSDLGFALRVVPNVLYYGGLIAAIGHFAARSAETP
jgi:hypothetical protein